MADPLTAAERSRRRAEQAGEVVLVVALPVAALVTFALHGGWAWLLAAVVLFGLSILARRVARGRPPRSFAEACCHRVDEVLRAGPPAERPGR